MQTVALSAEALFVQRPIPPMKEARSPSATAMKDVNTKPGEEQGPPAAPSVIRDERRRERREQKGGRRKKRSLAVASELHKRRGKFASL